MSRSLVPLAALSLLLCSCEFRSRRIAWHPSPGVTFKLRYSAETRAKAEGGWGAAPYATSARAAFAVKAAVDSAKGQIELSLAVDSLDFRAAERSPEEDAYMDGRLRKYRAKVSLSRTGQLLALEEEPDLPPVEFSPLAIGRWLAFALPAFPDKPIRQGTRWDITQPLLDKFHPDSRVVKRFTLSALRQTPRGEEATCLVEIEAWLAEDLGDSARADGDPAAAPTLKGSGKVVFDLGKGLPVAASLELSGRFPGGPPPGEGRAARGGEGNHPLRLQETLELAFSD